MKHSTLGKLGHVSLWVEFITTTMIFVYEIKILDELVTVVSEALLVDSQTFVYEKFTCQNY